MIIGSTPWWLALATGFWFALVAQRAERNWVLWAISGALFAVVTATLILGLGCAMTIPFSDHARTVAQTEWIVAVISVIAVLGLLFTLGLCRQILVGGRSVPSAAAPTAANPPQTK